MPRIYRSPDPEVTIPQCSLFSLVFGRDFDPESPALIDAPTGYTLSRKELQSYALQFAWSLQNTLGQKRNSTMAIMSPNSIMWPIVLLGAIAAGVQITTVNSDYTPAEIVHQLSVSALLYILAYS